MIHSAPYLKSYHEKKFVLVKKREYLMPWGFVEEVVGSRQGWMRLELHSRCQHGQGREGLGRRFYSDMKDIITRERYAH
jgi:hypothetical protein